MKIYNYTFKIICSLLLLFISNKQSKAQLVVTSSQTATALAQKLSGNGITVLNASLTCAAAANGIFSASASNLGIDSGIVLTTGLATSVAGAEPGLTSYNNNTNGDAALQALSGAGSTRDACILQFDLVPKGDTVKFDYVFGSEEYINSVCGPYNDAFAFFISGPGIAGTDNMAQVPGTVIPVAVNSINNGIPGTYGAIANCTSMGSGSPFTSFYNDNTNGTTVAYRGLTTVLTAAHAVSACDTYHLKLTIADALNGLYDSGVFIKAGSLQSSTFNVEVAGAVNTGGSPAIYKGCTPGSFTFSRSVAKPTPQILTYQIGGTAVNGTDYTAIPTSVTIPANATSTTLTIDGLVTPANGPKTLKLYLNAPYSCNGVMDVIDSAELQIMDAPHADLLSQDTTICDGVSLPILVDGDNNLTYKWSPATGLSNPNIKNPLANPSVNTTYTLKAYIPGSGCDTISGSVSLDVLFAPFSVSVGSDIFACEHTPIVIDPVIVTDHSTFTYEWTGPQGFSSTNKELDLTDPLVGQAGEYVFKVDGGICGAVSDSVFINVVLFPSPPSVISPVKMCMNSKAQPLNVNGVSLKWYTQAEGGYALSAEPDINTSVEGTTDYYVSQSYGQCESDRVKFTVIVERCCDDNIFIPSAFTPNNDGLNDQFQFTLHGEESKILEVEIFNRWGQMVYHSNSGQPWNGAYNGTIVESGNYFYLISFTCKDGTIIKKKGEVLVVR